MRSVRTAPSRSSIGQRIYRFLFRFLGPADLGDPNEGPPATAVRAIVCPRCGRPMSEHSYIDTPERKRLRCP